MTIQLQPFTPFLGKISTEGSSLDDNSSETANISSSEMSISTEDERSYDEINSESETCSCDRDSLGSLDDFIISDGYQSDFDDSNNKIRQMPHLSYDSEDVSFKTPNFLKKCKEVQNLTARCIKKGKFNVIGRENETNTILELLSIPKGARNILLIGPHHIGKKSILKSVAERVTSLQSMEIFKGRSMLNIDCLSVISNFQRDTNDELISRYVHKVVYPIINNFNEPIICFQGIENFLNDEKISSYLKPVFNNKLNFIATVSGSCESKNVSKVINELAPFNFYIMKVNECPLEYVPKIIENKLNTKGIIHENITYSKETIDFAVRAASEYINNTPAPYKVIDLLCRTAANLFRMNHPINYPLKMTSLDVAKILSNDTGVDVETIHKSSWEKLLQIEENLRRKIVGQDYAISQVCTRVKLGKMKLKDSTKPIGAFLFVGPTGVGKTLLAEMLAKELNSKKEGLVFIRMEEYTQETSLNKLTGVHPGYEKNEVPGTLDGPLKENPHAVVLFDEIEKAHGIVIDSLMSMIDKGEFKNGNGDTIDCRNATFIMTSNVGAKKLLESVRRDESLNEQNVLDKIDEDLRNEFRAEFLNRLTIVPFRPLTGELKPNIVSVNLQSLKERYQKDHGADLTWSQSVVAFFSSLKTDRRNGMKELCRTVTDHVDKSVLDLILKENLDGVPKKISLGIRNKGLVVT
ncbi:MAG: AAA family ATPase [Chlamydiota bacterium]|nr:AAA family ATPase [Chlamydiota bacterium]